jgi:hypothetical protein
MKTKILLLVIMSSLAAAAFSLFKPQPQTTEDPWTAKQLMEPADLAAMLKDPNAKLPIIFCIGPANYIKGAIDIGPARDKANLDKMKDYLAKLPKDTSIVIYCGCCPFKPCPNVRPAFRLLNEMKFTNHKLLNLSHNFKTDWIDKGYPVAEEK